GLLTVKASDVEMRPPLWLWQDFIPFEELTIIGGLPKVNKSCVTLSFAATVTTGREWPDGDRIKPMNVLLFSAEDKRDTTIVPRLKAMGADLKKVEIVDCTRYKGREAVFSVARDLPLLERKLEENGEIGVVILDPIKSFLGEKADANDEIK